jgi:GNAT superfamily N-acetyltransferase
MPHLVRLATAEDASALAAMRAEMDGEAGVVEPPGFRDDFVSWFRSPANHWTTFVADADGTAVGTLWMAFMSRVPRPSEPVAAPLGRLTNFFVRAAHRNAGIGSALLAAATDLARAERAELVLVWPSERSMPLYGRHGYAPPADLLVLELDGQPTT